MIEEYVPLNLWIREDQMETLIDDAYNQSKTIYTLIRNIIDSYYSKRSLNEETNIDSNLIDDLHNI